MAGQLTLSGGRLQLLADVSLAATRGLTFTAGTSSVIDANGATLRLNDSTNGGGAGTLVTFANSSALPATIVYLNFTSVDPATKMTVDPNVTLDLGGGTAKGFLTSGLNPGDLTDNGTLRFDYDQDTSFNGKISGSGSVIFTNQTTARSMTLRGANSYTGDTTLEGANVSVHIDSDSAFGNGGTLYMAGGNISPNSNPTRPIGNHVVLTGDVSLGLSNHQGGLLFSNSIDFSAGARRMTVTVPVTVAGGVQNATGLTKDGDGVLTLAGSNAITGTMAVDLGTLTIAGNTATSLGASAIVVGKNDYLFEDFVLGSTADVFSLPGGLNRLSDSASIRLLGASLEVNGPALGSTGFNETIGSLVFGVGVNVIKMAL